MIAPRLLGLTTVLWSVKAGDWGLKNSDEARALAERLTEGLASLQGNKTRNSLKIARFLHSGVISSISKRRIMKTLNARHEKSSFTSLSKSFFILLTLSLSLMFALAIDARAQAFDFSLSAYGPHNVVQGRDIYVNVSGNTLSGAGGHTYLSVQNVPAGISRFWPDFDSTCCGGGNDGAHTWQTATFDTALRITAAINAPLGSYTIQITATNNGITRQTPYTFNVLAPPAPTVPPTISSTPAIPNLSNWQSNMTTYGQQVCNYLDTPGLTDVQRRDWTYYDQIRVMYQISDYVPASASYWNGCALKARSAYRDGYVLPQNGGVRGEWVFTTGLRMDYERTADAQSKNAALLLSQNGSFMADTTPWNYLIDNATSRETAYSILAKLDAEKLGEPPSSRLGPLVDIALGHMDQWFVSKTFRCRFPNACDPASAVGQYYIQPFMVGLTMRALIVYYEKTQDPRIPPIIKTAADWLWANAWVASGQAFWYQNHVSDPSQPFPSQPGADDLNLLIAPAYAWLYRQTGDATYQSRGDQIFSGGVMGPLSQVNLSKGKQFDENYIWSFDYVKWRTASPSGGANPVVWTNLAGTTATGNTLQKTSGQYDSGAISQQQITATGGYVEFKVSAGHNMKVGFSNDLTASTDYTQLKYYFNFWGSGDFDIREGWANSYNPGTHTANDLFRIGVEGGAVKYYKNGVLLRTSTVAPSYPLVLDTAITTMGGTIQNAVINTSAPTPPTQPVTWTEVAYAATEADGGLTTTTINNMATAVAVQQLTDGNYLEIIPNNVSGNTQYRINTVGNRDVYRRISIGGGNLSLYDTSGAFKAETTVTTASVIRISLEGTSLKIYKDGAPVYTFTDTLSAPLEFRLFIWVTSSNLGAGLTSASFSSPSLPRTNFALTANGATATASSILNSNFPASAVINGDRKGLNWGNGGGWADSSSSTFPDWVQIDFGSSRTIDEIDVFTIQDNYTSPVQPTESMTFTIFGMTGYNVQYWNGSGWTAISEGQISGNNKVWRKITFTPITTSKIRVNTTAAIDNGYSRLTEIEAWGSGASPVNVAAAANGATATASSVLNANFPASGVINGDRKGLNWGSGGGWADNSAGTFPDWVQIDFNGSKTITEIDLFTLQNNYTNPSEPTEAMTFSTWGVTGYNLEYWNGSAWTQISEGQISGNNKVWRKVTFSPITTTKIRVNTTATIDNGYSRLTEVEAWTPASGGG